MKKRGPGKIKTSIKSYDRYSYYNRNVDGEHKMNIQTYRKVVNLLNKGLRNLILLSSSTIKLPHRIGYLRIIEKDNLFILDDNGKIKTEYLKPDWKKTKEKGKMIYHTNEHTDNTYNRWWWEKRTANFKNQTWYQFIACRESKTMLANISQRDENKIKYYR